LALTGLVKHPANLAALRDEMDRVVPWGALVQIVEPHAPRAKTGRPPFAIETMLRIHYLHVWTRRLLQALIATGNGLHTCIRLADGRMPVHARSLDEIRALQP
jgi:hypothetical protein